MSDVHRDHCLTLARDLWPAAELAPETVRNDKRSGRKVRLVAPLPRRRVLAQASSWRQLARDLERARRVRGALTSPITTAEARGR